ncbi:hypothetical protein QFZ65_001964 [Arthrobacter sp. B3I9]|uniref:hypothetical protein n=1 Tax=Arthrobacter sp. B3I9 TaxID=3042270 RepID=UPI0027945894|nr:hypothetical protein [Arthrobacter sp. B3I9]MDQ0850026.1 hypothetical protein [Arthrobacter sp. B3I9]
MKKLRTPTFRAAMSFLASGAVLALSAAPAAAAPPRPFYFPEACNYVPAPFDQLVCISQTGRYSQVATPSGKTVTRAAIATSTTVYTGPSKTESVTAWSDTTQQFSVLAASGDPALFQLRQVVRGDNVLVRTSCMVNVRFVITGTQIRQTHTEASCQ